ncbi:MAG TPA: hypothetical protein VNQ90_20370 [Chthoniobacteraceae bacterium]|nr:hypothetical protein [Chthoniobacteraceae bacterium]
MRDLYSEEEAAPATTVQFRWADDDSGLYVGITAMEPEMERLRTAITVDIRDSESIYDTDLVELFMETPERSTFIVAVNPEGAIYDKCTDSRVVENPVSWSAGWKVATRKGGDRWTVELFIPKESLAGAAPPTADAPWGVNIGRTRFLSGKAHNSAISPTQGGFFQTVKFGNLIAPPPP